MKYNPAGKETTWGRWVIIGALALILLVGPIVGVALANTSYRVQPGDTLISIAARYGVSVDAIVAANGLPNRSTIYAGHTLTIPSQGSYPSNQTRQASGAYVVQPGDSLSGIALLYGTTADALKRANGMTSSTIYAGQVLRIVPASYAAPPPAPPQQPQQPQQPPQSQPATNPGRYTVQPGDSLTTVAARFGVSKEALAAANGVSPSSYLYLGQVLTIPGAGQQPQQPQQPAPPTATAIATTIATAAAIATATPIPVPPTMPPLPTDTSVPLPTAIPPTVVPTSQTTTTPQPVESPGLAEPGKPVKYTVQPGDTLSSIAAKFSTTIQALRDLNNLPNTNIIYVGQVLIIVKGNDQGNAPSSPTAITGEGTPTAPAGLSTPTSAPPNTPTPAPTPPIGKFGPKWVDVNLTTQTMVAYEGQTPVYSSRVSSGVWDHPTVIGTYRIYVKYVSTRMTGGVGAEHYDIPNVPYTMYFYSGYALHGAYWHHNFGQPMSHGCVNLPVDVSKWMFEWAPIGTMVVTHK